MGKGSRIRPLCTGREENELRKALANGDIDQATYDFVMKELAAAGKITRNGRVIRFLLLLMLILTISGCFG